MSISKEKKTEVIKNFAIKSGDTGSAQVQVAVLTERINSLTEHMKTHKKDFSSRRGLLMLVSKRKSLLSYIRKNSEANYKEIIQRLGLRG